MELRGYKKLITLIAIIYFVIFVLFSLASYNLNAAVDCQVSIGGSTKRIPICNIYESSSPYNAYFCLPDGSYFKSFQPDDYATYDFINAAGESVFFIGSIVDLINECNSTTGLSISAIDSFDYFAFLVDNSHFPVYVENNNLVDNPVVSNITPDPIVPDNTTSTTTSADFTYVPQSGAQCLVNYADCQTEFGNNYSNLFEDINNGSIRFFNITEEIFRRVFTGRAPSLDTQKVCYNKTIYSGDIIAFTLPDTLQDGSSLSNLGYMQLVETFITTNGDITLDLIGNTFVSACPIGTRATRSVFSFGIDTFGLGFLGSQHQYNCCPHGYSFVNKGNQATLADSGVGVCCKGNPSEFISGDGNSCTKTDGTTISLDQHPKSNNLDIFVSDIRNGNELSPIYGGGVQHGRTLGLFGSSIIHSTINWGLPLIGVALNETVFQSNTSAPSQTCPDSFPANSCVRRTDANNVDTILSKENYDQQSAFQCSKCFLPGEAIRVDKDSQKLHVCDTTQPNNYREEDLINGNVNDTIAFLQADATNQPLLQSCREQGGLYIAIGCVDPTPIGIITGAIRISFGVLGGVALLQIILAGIAYQSGEEARIQAARNRVFATLGGVSLLVFSVLVLRIIGVNVLDVVPSTFF